MSGFYVYVHRRRDDKKIFYVGKGSGPRHSSTQNRNIWWHRVSEKHGFYYQIVGVFDDEKKAFAYEERLIRRLRKKGFVLCNIHKGGSGGASKAVYCSNGRRFSSLAEAADFCSKDGVKAKFYHISSCARGKLRKAYGFAWSFNGVPSAPVEKFKLNTKKSKKIYCSNGMDFISLAEAARWVQETSNRKASGAQIGSVADKDMRSAYGYAWSFIKTPEKPKTRSEIGRKLYGVPVTATNDNETISFDSLSSAAAWLTKKRGVKTEISNINACLKGRIKKAYSYYWSYTL